MREAGFWNREKKLARGIWNPQGFFVVGVWKTTQGVRNPTYGAMGFQVPLTKNPKSTKEIQNSDQFMALDPESKTVLYSLSWGDSYGSPPPHPAQAYNIYLNH